MIVRTRGVTASAKAEQYLEYPNETGIRELLRVIKAVYLLRRIEGDSVHFLIVTFWELVDAIKRFAGPYFDKAKCYPKGYEYLLEREPTVAHYEVADQQAP